MINTARNHKNSEKSGKKVFNLIVEKLVREANDSFIYYRDCQNAIDLVNEAISIEPNHIKALILKGNILFSLDKDTEALEYFDRAIKLNPFSAEAYGLKAGTLDILGRQIEALNFCEKAFEHITVKDRHLLPSLYDQKLAILVRMKKYEQARAELKNCTKILAQEDGSYLISCYQEAIETSCREKKRKRELVAKISLQIVS